MGLGFLVQAALPKSIHQNDEDRNENLISTFETKLRDGIGEELLKKIAKFERSQGYLEFTAYPTEEPIYIKIREDQIECSAKTSTAGPGYHAWLVELIESIGEELGLDWKWSDEKDDIGDETGYHEHRNFEKLQEEMLLLLQGLARHLVTEIDHGQFTLGLPLYFRVTGDYFAISPLGYWEKEWFERIANADSDQLWGAGPAYFPWWGKYRDERFWETFARMMCWSVLPWHVPRDESERALYEATQNAFHRSRTTDLAEYTEIRCFLENDAELDLAPKSDLIGFRRRPMKHSIGGGWTVTLPGYYYQEEEEDGTELFWFGDRTIRASAFRKEGASREECILTVIEDPRDDPSVVTFEQNPLAGKAFFSEVSRDNEHYQMLQGVVATAGRFLLLTICFDDNADRDWAIGVWKTATHYEHSQ